MTGRFQRRGFLGQLPLLGLGALGTAGWVGRSGQGQEAPRASIGSDSGAELITPQTQVAINQGLAYLAEKQAADGSYQDRFASSSVGISALAGLALMAAGHHPGRGRYGRQVTRVVDYLLASGSNPSGFLGSLDLTGRIMAGQAGMYNHGFGVLFLAEVCGMVPETARQKQVRETLEKAVGFIVTAQGRDGGWRYEPQPQVADVSVTVAMMMALRAARNAGVFIRKAVIDQGVKFIRACQMPDGGFSYFRGQGYSAFARSAAAVVGLYSAGLYQGEEIHRGLRYLEQFRPGAPLAQNVPSPHYYYGHYYAALAMWTAGRDYWLKWFPAIRDELLLRFRRGLGAWSDDSQVPAYATAMALIILQLPNNYLPILQR